MSSVVESELLRIFTERGRLTAADVVAEATPADAPLHSHFVWDDSEASQRYRLIQAAGLIRSHKVRIVTQTAAGTEEIRVRQWVPASAVLAPDAEPGKYLPVTELTGVERNILLQRMQREINGLRLRYSHLAEFWEQIDQLKQNGQASSG
jgi:hypothetical protein